MSFSVTDFRPSVKKAIDRLREEHKGHPHIEKMVNTIYALVEARLEGKPETDVFKRKDCCSANTYHTKWKHDSAFAAALALATDLAREWKDVRHIKAIDQAVLRMQLASTGAAAQLAKQLKHPNPNVVYRAAVAILDRAGIETAAKMGKEVETILRNLDYSKLTDEQIERIREGEHPLRVLLDIGED